MVTYIRSDLDFILQQIVYSERQAAGESLTDILPNQHVSFGLRTVDGSLNNLVLGQSEFGAADNVFPRMLPPEFREAEFGTSYQQTHVNPAANPQLDPVDAGVVIDSQPRTISNLIVDQTITNPSAVQAFVDAGLGVKVGDVLHFVNEDGSPGDPVPPGVTLKIPNTTPDEGLSAGFNTWFTLFGQFFDHGLDLVSKGGSGIVFVPLQPDDPLWSDAPGARNFMILTRATNQPGEDGILGTDDDIHEQTNTTSPFIDQNQTYSSHASHQVFLRAYEASLEGPRDTGKLLESPAGGMATWGTLKAQARDVLGIDLTDFDVGNVPLLATDLYGNFLRGPNGFPQVVVALSSGGTILIEGDPLAPVNLADPMGDGSGFVVRTGHAFLDDIAATTNPFNSLGGQRTADTNDTADDHFTGLGDDGLPMANNRPTGSTNYDDELLDAHYVAGDGRVNENIGLTAVHAVFHSEHNRLVDHTKSVLIADAQEMLAGGATQADTVAFLNQWLTTDVAVVPASAAGLDWDGQRLFQAAKFGTEMQYQHLVFEEFARKVQPNIDEFLAPEGYDATIDPSIVAEFAHTVYRFGHSMLTETVDRFDPDFNTVNGDPQLSLLQAFLNPLAYLASSGSGFDAAAATGAIVRGTTRDAGNEIDEFVTDVLRNGLLGQPLDLAVLNLARGRDTGIPSLNSARQSFYDQTQETQLKPYESWIDFMAHLKHPESLINFIAAYGTHAAIAGATGLQEKRDAATLLVLGDGNDSDGVTIGGNTYTDRFDFLNATGDFAGGSLGGLNNVDFWIGGLAEAQQPFGGLLGATFNFVFETQLEALQNGDRFYYLARTAGMNFLNELEGNSFAKMIMNNSNATHLPADVFSTPAFTLEVDPSTQFTGLGTTGRDDPTGGIEINGVEVRALVERDDPGTVDPDVNYLRYNGEDHVVLGGTAGNDTIISSIGDDTLYGDGGNDRLEGGDGVDNIEGGAGDDILTDLGGDDVIKGGDGNDVISAGNGFNLIIGGAGSDFIITGEDVSDTFGGTGNDFILGAPLNLPTLGNEGDDWIEIGTSDGAGGDNFDPQEAGTITGHDVFITGTLFDEVDGEGGDDIMVGSDGADHFGGGGGYDWASYENDTRGTTIDLNVNDFVEPPVAGSASGILDRFAQVEGLSGTNFNDVLRGDDMDAGGITAGGGAQDSTLRDPSLVDGLQQLLDQAFGQATSSFNGGNIILGGSGSDIIEGRGGDDIIEGDKRFNVRIEVTGTLNSATGQPYTFETMKDPLLLQNMLNGTWNPGQLQIVREILSGNDGYDTAVFSDNLQSIQTFRDVNGDDVTLTVPNYIITTVGGVTTVRHVTYERDLDANNVPVVAATADDGEDRLMGIERLQFANEAFVLDATGNAGPVGQLAITDPTGGAPALNEVLTVSAAGITDADNVSSGGAIGGPIAYYWQSEAVPGSGIFSDIITLDGSRFTREQEGTLTVTADLDGLRLRVRAVYEDENGTLENVYSEPTLAVSGSIVVPPPAPLPVESETTSAGIHLIRSDLQFILEQIRIAERHAGGEDLADIVPNSRLPFGLRTVDGTYNNIVSGQETFGAADQPFPTLAGQNFRDDQDGDQFGPVTNTNYAANGDVVDADPRIISNLISDQTITNPVAVAAFVEQGRGVIVSGVLHYLNEDGSTGTAVPRGVTLTITNSAPDEGLSAGFNSWMTLFGQFFDHGLDLVNKGDNGTVYVPLMPDDPLITHGPDGVAGTGDELTNPGLQFMPLTRATNIDVHPGADGDLGTADDIHLHNNQTTPFVDQNQTYTSHASHQVFLREYVSVSGRPVNTGRLLDGTNPDGSPGGLPTWAQIKAQALMLGIQLTDADIVNVPYVRADAYGNFIPDPLTGMAQVIFGAGSDGLYNTEDDDVVSGTPTSPINTFDVGAARTGHAFLDDIAHTAASVGDHDRNPGTPAVVLTADTDNVINGDLNKNGVIDGSETAIVQGINLNNDADLRDIISEMSEAQYSALLGGIDIDLDGDLVANETDLLAGVRESVLGLDLNNDGDTLDDLTNVVEKFYDDELLDAHFITGDGRGNENIGLTAVHHVFHSEHNRLVDHIHDVILASNDVDFVNEWLLEPIAALPSSQAEIDALVWNGERLFQAARFGTEMQYQHLVFEEFARKVQPQVDIFLGEGQGYDTTINPAILAEFAHTVYRFGHTMLTESVDRMNPDFTSNDIGLVEAFLNPLAFRNEDDQVVGNELTADEAAGAIIRGMTRQAGSEIDEFVTEALRNNLLGLPLDLPAINITRGRDTGVPSLNDSRAEFFAMTGDTQLKPYTSWSDFMLNLRHPMSVINFVAAYGTHASITDADTLADKRAAATLLVLGDFDVDGDGNPETAPADRVAFMNATGPYAGGSLGGLNTVDFWIGGLAEKQMPFGGLLGSTFNFIFETQMESLQNGDRFYYLERTAGLNFLTELENNTFAKIIMANTNTTHLPGDVFSTPAWTLEVDQSRQFTGIGDGNDDPTGGIAIRDNEITPLVIRDVSTNSLSYTGGDHVVLGGTENNDIITSGIGDDTLYGDGGDDRLEGGDGVDMVFGGAGNDIITDLGGEDNLQGGDGHDAIHGGNGIDLILGGFGNDFIVSGEDSDEAFGGTGNDFFLGDRADEAQFGNEGDDWIQGGSADGAAGDSFDVRGLDLIRGNDVFMGDVVADRMFGEGGDDILIGNGGFGDRYLGASGFDWASFQGDRAAEADMTVRAFDATPIPVSPVTVMPRFEEVEGMSGSTKSDILRGDDRDAGQIATSGGYGSTLENISLISGLQQLLNDALGGNVTSFNAGNIMLGGAGGDLLEGGGGNDLIDGDKHLHVRISIRDTGGNEIGTVTSLTGVITNKGGVLDGTPATLTLQQAVFSGLVNPGQLEIVREILQGNDGYDTAMYSGPLAEYEIYVNGALVAPDALPEISDTDVVTVAHRLLDDTGAVIPDSVGTDGTDTLTNVERLQFADTKVILVADGNSEPVGTLSLSDDTPNVGDLVGVSAFGLTDADNPGGAVGRQITYIWQAETAPGSGVFEDILLPVDLGNTRALGHSLRLTPELEGFALRVKGIYEDANGTLETVFSAVTGPVGAADPTNTQPVVLNPIADATVTEDVAFSITLPLDTFFDAQQVSGTLTLSATLLGGAPLSDMGLSFNPATRTVSGRTPENFNGTIDIEVIATDSGGLAISDTFTITVNPVNDAPVINGFVGTLTENEDGAITISVSDVEDGDFTVEVPVLAQDFEALTNGEAVVTGTIVDSGGASTNYSFNVPVTNVDEAGSGAVNIAGMTATGTGQAVLSASNNLADPDVTGTLDVTYEWRDLATNSVIGSDPTLTIAPGTVVQQIGLTATYVDGPFGNEPVVLAVERAFAGTNGNQTINGTTQADFVAGFGGDDTLNGGLGGDVLAGGLGNDSLSGAGGNDTAVYTADLGTTVFGLTGLGNITAATLTEGTDTLNSIEAARFGATTYTIFQGTAVANTNGGTANADLMLGFGGADTLNGGAGADFIFGGAGNDIIGGGNNDDTIVYFTGDGRDRVDGGANDLDGDRFIVNGNNAAETFRIYAITAGQNSGLGASLSTTFNVNTEIVITRQVGAGLQTVVAELDNIEELSVNGSAVSVPLPPGTAGGDTIIFNGNFTSTSLNFNTFTITGGEGDDTVDITGLDSEHRVVFNAGGGNDAIVNNRLRQQDVIQDSGETLTLLGTSAKDVMSGAGRKLILDGRGGNDIYKIDGDDVVREAGNGGIDVIHSYRSVSLLQHANVEHAMLFGSGNNSATGNSAGNILNGETSSGANVLRGLAGNDTYVVGGADKILESAHQGIDTVISSTRHLNLQDHKNVENAKLTGAQNLSAHGNADDNVLTGNSGNNVLIGGAGNDRLNGDLGNDRLNGGTGNDTYDVSAGQDVIVLQRGFGNDIVNSFDPNAAGGQDKIDISALGITGATFQQRVWIGDVGPDTVIWIDHNTLKLKGLEDSSQVSIEDFVLFAG